MRRRFRAGTWRQAAITYSAVLPVSLILNLAMSPMTTTWPRLVVVILNATILVVSLNWVLLPALHWATRDWVARSLREGGKGGREADCDGRASAKSVHVTDGGTGQHGGATPGHT